MPVVATCNVCRREYHLKDDFAGRKVKCQDCGSVILVPMTSLDEAWNSPEGYGSGPFDRDRFLVNQKRISISEKYYIMDEDQTPILFVERPAHLLKGLLAVFAGIVVGGICFTLSVLPAAQFGNHPDLDWLGVLGILLGFPLSIAAILTVVIYLMPKRHIFIYTDDTKTDLLLEVLQDQKVSFIRATYSVLDPVEGPLGKFQKNYLYNLIRKRWDAFSTDGTPLLVAREDSLILSLLRRLLGPLFGFLRTNYIFLRPNTDTVIGEFNRKFTLFDRYVLDLTADRAHEIDRRIAVALGILLDTGERR